MGYFFPVSVKSGSGSRSISDFGDSDSDDSSRIYYFYHGIYDIHPHLCCSDTFGDLLDLSRRRSKVMEAGQEDVGNTEQSWIFAVLVVLFVFLPFLLALKLRGSWCAWLETRVLRG